MRPFLPSFDFLVPSLCIFSRPTIKTIGKLLCRFFKSIYIQETIGKLCIDGVEEKGQQRHQAVDRPSVKAGHGGYIPK